MDKGNCCADSWWPTARGSTSGAITRTDSRSTARKTSTATGRLDECRWLNAGGTRIATDRQGPDQGLEADHGRRGVQGVGSGTRRRRSWAARNSHGDTRGPDGGRRAQGNRRQGCRGGRQACRASSASFRQKLVGWNKQTIWNRFDGTFPHVIPAESSQRTGERPDALRKRHGHPGNHGRPSRIRPSSRSCRFPT